MRDIGKDINKTIGNLAENIRNWQFNEDILEWSQCNRCNIPNRPNRSEKSPVRCVRFRFLSIIEGFHLIPFSSLTGKKPPCYVQESKYYMDFLFNLLTEGGYIINSKKAKNMLNNTPPICYDMFKRMSIKHIGFCLTPPIFTCYACYVCYRSQKEMIG